ncbi:hypothetical protein [Bifidobacterium indicum]|uniref:hypothetical protein n=1 Tax=Bifidobacterium indicum TaxID=1691 RepID=UPI003BB7025A
MDERVYRSVLAMLSGEFTSEGFTAFRPILVRDRQTGRIKARPGAQRLAVTSGGTHTRPRHLQRCHAPGGGWFQAPPGGGAGRGDGLRVP